MSPLYLFLLILALVSPSQAQDLHKIQFKSQGLYPEGLTYDPVGQHFIVAPLRGDPSFHYVTDAGVTEPLKLTSTQLPANSTVLGLAVDRHNRRLLAAVNSPSSPLLASFKIRGRFLDLEFLSPLHPPTGIANGVAVDPHGNAYVTNSEKNFIWKVDTEGVSSILSNSSLFTRYPVDETSEYSYCGLNGVAYVSAKEYILVVQSNTGKMFKVDTVDGTTRTVGLPEHLALADGIAVRDNGVVVVVSMNSAWFLRSKDSWSSGVVIDKIALDKEGYPTSVAVGGGGRVYAVYGYVQEVIKGISQEREWFRIEEIIDAETKREREGESLWWPVLLIGLGLGYFLFWKLQMSRLVTNMDQKQA